MTQQTIDEKFLEPAGIDRMSHPDPHGPPDRRPIAVGEVWENPVTGSVALLTWTLQVASRNPSVCAQLQVHRPQSTFDELLASWHVSTACWLPGFERITPA
jgi:hypothetical protein